MAGPGIIAAAEGRVQIVDAYLNDHANDDAAVIDIEKLTPHEAFTNRRIPASATGPRFCPRSIKTDFEQQAGGVENYNAAFAFIKGTLKNDPLPIRDAYSLRQVYPMRFTKIYPKGTTARQITILA